MNLELFQVEIIIITKFTIKYLYILNNFFNITIRSKQKLLIDVTPYQNYI